MGFCAGIKALAVKVTFNGDISKWETGQVTDYVHMFEVRFCVQPRHWGVEHSASDYMGYMFRDASAFNQDIGSWNTEKVTNMEYMFIPLLRSTKTLGVGTQRK